MFWKYIETVFFPFSYFPFSRIFDFRATSVSFMVRGKGNCLNHGRKMLWNCTCGSLEKMRRHCEHWAKYGVQSPLLSWIPCICGSDTLFLCQHTLNITSYTNTGFYHTRWQKSKISSLLVLSVRYISAKWPDEAQRVCTLRNRISVR